MIKKLKTRFILIAMASISIVLAAILGSINIINYRNVSKNADRRLSLIAETGGDFSGIRGRFFTPVPPALPQDGSLSPDNALPQDNLFPQEDFLPENDPLSQNSRRDMNFRADKIGALSAEAPFDTRFFTVTLDENGAVLSTNTESIASVSAQDASGYACALWKKGKSSGFWGSYKYALVPDAKDGSMYIFLDCQRELDTFRSFLFASIGISIAGLLLVGILVVLFSGIVVRPIAESYEKQKRFITDASHEIKTPLTIIDANTEVIEMENGETEWTKSIRNQIKRLTDLTGNLVFLSRMDEEAAPLTMLEFSLSDAAEETVLPYEAVAAAQGKHLSVTIAPRISYCGDEASIRQALSLLLDNAMKYSMVGSTVVFSLSMSGGSRVLTVKNKASDLPDGNLDLLFERFYRPDASRNSATGGHGIGLSVAKAIVLAHKGKISARRVDNETVEFKIVL